MADKKVLKDLWKHKLIFLVMFIIVFCAFFKYTVDFSYNYGIKETVDEYYTKHNLQDLWVYTKSGFEKEEFVKVKTLENVHNAERVLPISANVKNSDKYKSQSNIILELNFIETNSISKMYYIKGEAYEQEKSGIWLDYYLAKNDGINIGDEIVLDIEGYELKEIVKGFIETPDHVYLKKNNNYNVYSNYGYAYLSINEFPKEYVLDKVYNLEKTKDTIDELKDFKNMLDSMGIVSYSNLPKAVVDEVRKNEYLKNVRFPDALEQVEDYENNREEFLKALDKNFKFENLYVFPKLIIDINDVNEISKTKKEINELILNKKLDFIERKDDDSYKGYLDETQMGRDDYIVLNSILLIVLSILLVLLIKHFIELEKDDILKLKKSKYKKYQILNHYILCVFVVIVVACILAFSLGLNYTREVTMKQKMNNLEITNIIVRIPLTVNVYFIIIVFVSITSICILCNKKIDEQRKRKKK